MTPAAHRAATVLLALALPLSMAAGGYQRRPAGCRAPTDRRATRLRILFGTDYPFPTAFQVLRVPVRTASGQMIHRYISVPTRFERRMYGMGFAPTGLNIQ